MLRLRPHWRKAPTSLLRDPPLFLGCAAAALLVVLAASSALLFTSAAGSSAFKDKVAQLSPLSAGIHISSFGGAAERSAQAILRGHAERGRAVARAVGGSPYLGAMRDTLVAGPFTAIARGRTADVFLVARAGARAHVRRLGGGGADGAWIADTVASHLRLRPGERIGFVSGLQERPQQARVGAVYRALWKDVANDDWVDFSQQIFPQGPDPSAPPTFVLVSRQELLRLSFAVDQPPTQEVWELPVAVDGMTLARARALVRRFEAVERQLANPRSQLSLALGCATGAPFRPTRCFASSSLVAAIHLADSSADAVAAPSRLLGGVGLAISLAVAAAVGVFLVARRRGEARYLYARGESAGGFALKTALETAPPLLLGGAAGFGLTLALVRLLQPDATFDPAGLRRAGAAGAAALTAAALLVVGAATLSFLRQFDTAPRLATRLRLVPWELVCCGLGAYLLVSLRGDAPEGSHPSLLVFALPLLLLAGVTGLVLRAVRRLLLRVGRGGGLPLAPYLAARRAAAGSGLLVALTILSAVALGVLFYGQALAGSLEQGARQKAEIAVGGDVQGTVGEGAPTPRLPFPATLVEVAYGAASVGSGTGPQVDVMEVDPATLGKTMHWDGAWGPAPETFLPRLARPVGGRLPVVVTRGLPDGLRAIWLSGERVPVEVVATVRAFPGMSTEKPLVVAGSAALRRVAGGGAYDPLEGGLTVVWARGAAQLVERTLAAPPLRAQYFVSVDDILHDDDVVAAQRTYSFLTALGLAVAVLSLVGVGLYLYARQRGQTIASALARRMGLGRRTEVVSLWLELSGILLFAAVVAAGVGLAAAAPVIGRTDPLPKYSPTPSFVVPWLVVGATFGVLLLVALAAAAVASVAARRSDVAQELRLV